MFTLNIKLFLSDITVSFFYFCCCLNIIIIFCGKKMKMASRQAGSPSGNLLFCTLPVILLNHYRRFSAIYTSYMILKGLKKCTLYCFLFSFYLSVLFFFQLCLYWHSGLPTVVAEVHTCSPTGLIIHLSFCYFLVSIFLVSCKMLLLWFNQPYSQTSQPGSQSVICSSLPFVHSSLKLILLTIHPSSHSSVI